MSVIAIVINPADQSTKYLGRIKKYKGLGLIEIREAIHNKDHVAEADANDSDILYIRVIFHPLLSKNLWR